MKQFYESRTLEELRNSIYSLLRRMNKRNAKEIETQIIHKVSLLAQQMAEPKAGYAYHYYSDRGHGLDREVISFNSDVFVKEAEAVKRAFQYLSGHGYHRKGNMSIYKISKSGYVTKETDISEFDATEYSA